MTNPGKYFGMLLCIAGALSLAACGGGGGGGGDGSQAANTLTLIDVSVGDFDGVALNEILKFEFSEDLDPDTVRPDTIQIREGPNYGIQVPGEFRVDGNMVYFYPRLPLLADLSDSGLQAGKPYRITLPGSPKVATVRNYMGERLPEPQTASFQTAVAGSPNVFIDNFLDPLPPQVQFVNPASGATEVPADSEIWLTFNRRPLHPATVNSGNIRLTMLERDGVVYNRIVAGTPELHQTHDSVSVQFVPEFPLADDATYRLEVDRRVQDLVSNDLTPFDTEFSVRKELPRYSDFTLNFTEAQKVAYNDEDVSTASWNEEVKDALAALFTAAGGNGKAGDLNPNASNSYDIDDFEQGAGVQLDDGDNHYYHTFNFRTVTIQSGVTIGFKNPSGGPNLPVKVLALKSIQIDGNITVNGGQGVNGPNTSTSKTTIDKAAGGKSGPGGADGAERWAGSSGWPKKGTEQDGYDVVANGKTYSEGGETGGSAYSSSAYGYAGGGGGGGGQLDGKDGSKGNYPSYASWNGAGGKGGKGWPANFERQPNLGGAGGGAGGTGGYASQGWRNGAGTGGGGGGALTLQSARDVIFGVNGALVAQGGNGGGTTAYAYYGGAGGGGGGGSFLVRATNQIVFNGGNINVSGGQGGPYRYSYTYYYGGQGGDGGAGYIRLEAKLDENTLNDPLIQGITKATMTVPPSTGLFEPSGGGAPSVGQTVWVNLGVFDPTMLKPAAGDIDHEEYNDTITYEVQMAPEDQSDLGNPDLDQVSEWVPFGQIADPVSGLNGNGYQFIRIRITYMLDSEQAPTHPLPFTNRMTVRFRF